MSAVSRRVLLVVCAAVALPLAGGIALAAGGDGPSKRKPPTEAEKVRLQGRIAKRAEALARQGIYIEATGRGKPCVSVYLANPTRPNIEYLRREFHGVCVLKEPMGRLMACTGYTPPSPPSGSVTVPDVGDLGLYEASRRVTRAGLTYTLNCLGERKTRAKRPSQYSPDQLARIADQCPRPGERVPPGTEVALEARALLPGGFEYRVGSLNSYTTGTSKPCADGRNPAPPEPER